MELLKYIKEALERIKATDVKVYDLRGISPLADFTVIATIDVARQGDACVNHLVELSKENNFKIKNVEGRESTWILVDLYDVILHIFTREERSNYDLDHLYLDIPQIDLNNLD